MRKASREPNEQREPSCLHEWPSREGQRRSQMGTDVIRDMSIKLIIFDFDGTLGDTRRNIVVTVQDVMKELNLPLQDEHVCASTIGLPLKGCYR